ncbi:biotin--[acetyl-CoA-carboxylase] ligase [Flavobacterium degerlachei]|jgi:BirA family biotin operon repressor/biotin-[acetyl-CoA-carboxylase] ligase|uniref:BirA family transcriptional regulator, biotin operon repressor / biotin-[acetyl-CoA-carboxylase] ligase n=1 Tax=Flavobacterium degerlachei TaxID=229203 RepID=A0A1H3A4E5_9FLAO|nr:biotin--[acetyl-CoA-carboxylase] ligase [Flavobacterium degerlachei]SDX24084.1 BirA family transcriptional regulator, biotin operon repressor / biotin-[acetyl-CoA-carboxylase] ligase [Flavobacterium degerlachei]
MKVIKLDAIDSTNEFLKGLSNKQQLENFTIVTAENQTKGKGQMGAVWGSEAGKNLTMSVFIKDSLSDVNQIFKLNISVALAVIEALETFYIPSLMIKWPNDIMSYNFKIGGILIENSIKSDGTVHSIVGLGINVNQINFENLPKASSLAVICESQFDKEKILNEIVKKIKQNIAIMNSDAASLWLEYTNKLFKKGIPMAFKDNSNQNFMGIIQGVSSYGKLQVQLEDDSISEYSIKEVQMLY